MFSSNVQRTIQTGLQRLCILFSFECGEESKSYSNERAIAEQPQNAIFAVFMLQHSTESLFLTRALCALQSDKFRWSLLVPAVLGMILLRVASQLMHNGMRILVFTFTIYPLIILRNSEGFRGIPGFLKGPTMQPTANELAWAGCSIVCVPCLHLLT